MALLKGSGLRAKDPVIVGDFLFRVPAEIRKRNRPLSGSWEYQEGVGFASVLASDLKHTALAMNASYVGTSYTGSLQVPSAPLAELRSVAIAFFESGYFILSIGFIASGWHQPASISAIANALVDDSVPVLIREGESFFPSELARAISRDALGISNKDPVLLQRFTEIDVAGLSPRPAHALRQLPDRHQRDLLTLVIRRQTSFKEFRTDRLTQKYESQSMYLEDYVCATPHNLFTYVAPDRGHIVPDFYAGRYHNWRVLSAVLQNTDAETRATMKSLSGSHVSTRNLRRIANESGRRAIELELWRQSFETIPQSIAARAKSFDSHVQEMLEVADLYLRIENRLNLLEQVVMTRYSLSIQVILQRISIGLSVLALVVAVIASVLSIG